MKDSIDKIICHTKRSELPLEEIESFMAIYSRFWNKKGFFQTYDCRKEYLVLTNFRYTRNVILGMTKTVETMIPPNENDSLKLTLIKTEYVNKDDELWTK